MKYNSIFYSQNIPSHHTLLEKRLIGTKNVLLRFLAQNTGENHADQRTLSYLEYENSTTATN
jgi:hypothetical protein